MKPSFAISEETEKLIVVIETMAIGQTLTWNDMSRLAGFNVHSSLPAYVSARRITTRRGIVTDAVRGVGVKRLSAPETVGKSTKHLARIRRVSRVGLTEIGSAIRSNLPREEAFRAMTAQAKFSITLDAAAPVKANSNSTIVETPPAADIPRLSIASVPK